MKNGWGRQYITHRIFGKVIFDFQEAMIFRVPIVAQWLTIPTRNHEFATLLSGLSIWHCCELWCRPAAIAQIGPLAWEPPYAALKSKKTKQNKQTNKKPKTPNNSLSPILFSN